MWTNVTRLSLAHNHSTGTKGRPQNFSQGGSKYFNPTTHGGALSPGITTVAGKAHQEWTILVSCHLGAPRPWCMPAGSRGLLHTSRGDIRWAPVHQDRYSSLEGLSRIPKYPSHLLSSGQERASLQPLWLINNIWTKLWYPDVVQALHASLPRILF